MKRERSAETDSEMARVKAILSLYEAAGSNAALAHAIAFDTDLTVEQARGALQAAQRDGRKGMPVSGGPDWDKCFMGKPS